MTKNEELIRNCLKSSFPDATFSVHDNSYRHKGHKGYDPELGSHFAIEIISKSFIGLSRIACHKAVNAALKPAIENGVHALEIKTSAS